MNPIPFGPSLAFRIPTMKSTAPAIQFGNISEVEAAQDKTTFNISDESFKILKEAFADPKTLGFNFNKPDNQYESVHYKWHFRETLWVEDYTQSGKVLYRLEPANDLPNEALGKRYLLSEVTPVSGRRSERRHPSDPLYSPDRTITAEDLQKVEELIGLIPKQKEAWKARWKN